jgi:Mor family transcriptional regulator
MSSSRPKVDPFLPDPREAELKGDLERMAEVIDRLLPGQGKRIVVDILQEFPGTYIYCVQPEYVFREPRERWILDQFDRGCRVAEIARVIGMSESQVWKILGKAPGSDRQLSLF